MTPDSDDLIEASPAGYVDHAAALLGLPLASEHRPGVNANMAQLRATVQPLLEFPLTAADDAAPVFEP